MDVQERYFRVGIRFWICSNDANQLAFGRCGKFSSSWHTAYYLMPSAKFNPLMGHPLGFWPTTECYLRVRRNRAIVNEREFISADARTAPCNQ